MNYRFKIISTAYKQYRALKKFNALSEQSKDNSLIPQDLAKDLMSLGPTFIKLGQILSTRPDILPSQYIKALRILQEDLPSFEYDEAVTIIESELQQPVIQLFLNIEKEPLASASLSQVHMATLKTGEEVVIKIQRPGLPEQMRAELKMLSQLLSFVRFFKGKIFRNLNLENVFREFQRYTLQELDFSLEGKTYDRFRENLKTNPKVVFPKVYWRYTTPALLTMERVSGFRLYELPDKMSTEVRRELSARVIRALINMFVRDGFFHADLHPGNIFFREDGSVAMIDVGMFGELTAAQRERFLLYWLAVASKEKKRAFHHLIKLTHRTSHVDEEGFYKQYEKLLDTFYSSSIQEKSLTRTYLDILISGAGFGFKFPSEMLLQAKALTTAEYIAYVLVPGFNFAEAVKPIMIDTFLERFSSNNIMDRIERTAPEWLLLGENAPPSLLNANSSAGSLWENGGKQIAKRWDNFHEEGYAETRHGEYSIEIDGDLDTVFNFVTRFARYPLWHPIYTEDSHVIHISGHYVFITPQVVGSVFRLDEIVDGYHLLSNGVITEFKKNQLMKWKAPFSMLPLIELGTCLEFASLPNGNTKLSEYFFFSESPLKHVFINRNWFSAEALTNHIREELTGIKTILEAGNYTPDDVSYLWENLDRPVRFLDGQRITVPHGNVQSKLASDKPFFTGT